MDQNRELEGKVALVTGSSRSIGAEIARTLAKAGADVVINARSAGDEAEQVAESCRAMGVRAVAVVADVSQPDGARQLFDEAMRHFESPNILVNNVGASPRVSFVDMEFEDWQTCLDINLNSQFRTCKLAVPGMIDKGWGRIVNLGGHTNLATHGRGVHVKASKAAVVGLMRGLAGELAPHGITVNVVAPHGIDTPPRHNKYYRDAGANWDPAARGMDKIPVGRLGKPSEIASLVRYLCGEPASYLTGQTYLVNGGHYSV